MFRSDLRRRIDHLEHRARVQDLVIAELARRAGVDVPTVDPYAIDDEERRLLAEGKTIAAIKHHRQRTGSGLKESKDVIDAAR